MANPKTKSIIILCLGDSALAKIRELVDGNGTAKELWDELERIYTMSSTQVIAKVQGKLEALSFKDGDDWDKQVSSFLSIIDELSAQDRVLSDAGKVTKILRTLLEYFDTFAMASSLNNNSFEQIVNAVQANVEQKKKLGSWKASSSSAGPSSNLVDGNNFSNNNNSHGLGRGRGCGRGRGNRGRG